MKRGRYRKGDATAFWLLYGHYRQLLYRYLLRACDSAADPDDLYQDAWSRVIAVARPFREGSLKGSIRILQGFKVLISHRFPSTFGVAKASNERGCGIYDYQQAYRKIA